MRIRLNFFLDLTKPDEREVSEAVNWLKKNRLFAKTIRDGIRLICTLRDGRTDVLLELFPWLQETLQEPPERSNSSGSGSSGDNDRIKALEAQIAQLTDAILKNTDPNSLRMVARNEQWLLPAPAPDTDNLLEVKQVSDEQRATSGKRATQNFLKSLAAIQNTDKPADGLPRKPAKKTTIPHITAIPVDESERTPGNAKALTGSDIALTAPVFDDLEASIQF